MFRTTKTSAARATLLAGGMALFASQAALAARPGDPHPQAHAQLASRAGAPSDKGVSAQYASRAGDRVDGANADA